MKTTYFQTNNRNELIPGVMYTVVNVNQDMTTGTMSEITYRNGVDIKEDHITFYITGINIINVELSNFINNTLKSVIDFTVATN